MFNFPENVPLLQFGCISTSAAKISKGAKYQARADSKIAFTLQKTPKVPGIRPELTVRQLSRLTFASKINSYFTVAFNRITKSRQDCRNDFVYQYQQNRLAQHVRYYRSFDFKKVYYTSSASNRQNILFELFIFIGVYFKILLFSNFFSHQWKNCCLKSMIEIYSKMNFPIWIYLQQRQMPLTKLTDDSTHFSVTNNGRKAREGTFGYLLLLGSAALEFIINCIKT